MEAPELTVEQCRFIAAIRARRPSAVVTLHGARGGLIVEVRDGRRVEFARIDRSGRVRRDRHVRAALARRASQA